MYGLTKHQKIGYFFIVTGIVICIINYILSYNQNSLFGYFPIYILSGILSAVGLTLVFNVKIGEHDQIQEKPIEQRENV